MKNKHFFVLFFKAGIDSLTKKFQNICSTFYDNKKTHNEYTIEKKLFRKLNVRLRIIAK